MNESTETTNRTALAGRDSSGLLSGWIDVDDYLPAIGQKVILFGSGVVQEEIFMLDASDSSDYHTEYFWSREDLDEGWPIEAGQMWQPLPPPPAR